MEITPIRQFRDGRTTYEEDQQYEVDDRDGARFVGNGWATSPDYQLPGTAPVPESTTLDVQSARHRSGATEV